jgi:hypothetical protein
MFLLVPFLVANPDLLKNLREKKIDWVLDLVLKNGFETVRGEGVKGLTSLARQMPT